MLCRPVPECSVSVVRDGWGGGACLSLGPSKGSGRKVKSECYCTTISFLVGNQKNFTSGWGKGPCSTEWYKLTAMLLVSKNSWFSVLHTFLPPCSLMKPFIQLAFIPPPLHLHLSTPGGSSSGWECTFSIMTRASVIVPMYSFCWMCCRLIILNSEKHTVKMGRKKSVWIKPST